MNYARQFNNAAPAPGTSAPSVRTNRTLAYSRSALATLAETSSPKAAASAVRLVLRFFMAKARMEHLVSLPRMLRSIGMDRTGLKRRPSALTSIE
jgi:hypothetical protein